MNPNRPMKVIVVALVIAGLLPSTFLPAHAFSGGVTTVYSAPTPDRVERARTFPAKTPELDQTYQRTMRAAASKVAIGAALRRAVRGFIEKLPVIGAVAVLATDLYGIWQKRNDGTNDLMVPATEACEVAPCTQYKFAGHRPYYPDWSTSAEGATRATIAAYPTENGKYSYRYSRCEVVGYDTNCSYIQRQRYLINEGSPNQTEEFAEFTYGGTITKRSVDAAPADPLAPKRALSDAELEDKLKADKPFLPILKQMDDLGSPVPFPDPEIEDMPQRIAISPTTVTHPDGSKTIEKVALEPYRAPDNAIQWKKTVETIEVSKPDAEGKTTSTTSTTTTDKGQTSTPEKPPEAPATDTDLPAQPKLYKQKYPEGITGVWQRQRDAMANSPLFTIAKTLMPAVGLSGSCPTMPVNLNFSQWANFGIRDVAPPCQVWDWGRAICIVSACLLARRLIFGG